MEISRELARYYYNVEEKKKAPAFCIAQYNCAWYHTLHQTWKTACSSEQWTKSLNYLLFLLYNKLSDKCSVLYLYSTEGKLVSELKSVV